MNPVVFQANHPHNWHDWKGCEKGFRVMPAWPAPALGSSLVLSVPQILL